MRVEPVRWRRISLSGNQPGRSVICIAVALVVTRDNVQQDPIFHVRPQLWKTASDSREHSPAKRKLNVGNAESRNWQVIWDKKCFCGEVRFWFFFHDPPKYVVSQWKMFFLLSLSFFWWVVVRVLSSYQRRATHPENEVANFSSASASHSLSLLSHARTRTHATAPTRTFMNEANQRFIYLCQTLHTNNV